MTKEDLIKKWLNDELSPAEKAIFEQGEDFVLYQSIVDGAASFKASSFSEPESFEAFKSAYDAKSTKVKSLDWYKLLLRIASVVVIALGLYFTFLYDGLTHIETIASQRLSIVLPDQSQVTLNADSEIEYDEKDWDENRFLSLKGEAYFKVAKGNTFDVITSQGVVTIVGTEFNVKQREDYFEVQCFEGIVSVSSGEHIKILNAGDTFRLFDHTFTQDKITFLEPQWTKNRSTFKAIPFKAVIAEMERQYNIKIIAEQVDTERLFTGGFMHDNIEKALLSITQPMDLSYKTNASNDVVIYGNKE